MNGTLINIATNESYDEIYRIISNFFKYQGVALSQCQVKEQYFKLLGEQKEKSGEHHPEFDAVDIFCEIFWDNATEYGRSMAYSKIERLPVFLAELFRAASLNRLELFDGVLDTIRCLSYCYRLGIVSDAQSVYALPELNDVGLLGFFDPVIISSDYGARKPERRLFEQAGRTMGIEMSDMVYVGNDVYRDVYGAQRVGMKTVLFRSYGKPKEYKGVKADYEIDSFGQLWDAIKFFEA